MDDASRARALSALLRKAVEVEESEREQLLERHSDDPTLVRDALDALAAETSDPEFLQSSTLIRGVIGEMEAEFSPPQKIGPYRVGSELGRGGMGIVYAVEHEESRRHFALKVMRWPTVGGSQGDRFDREWRVLEALRHPAIARFHDADQSRDGRPYIVMELVDGVPITHFCDQHRLTVADRVDLFLEACEGVDYAHGRQLLHRDLKPSNLLVGPDVDSAQVHIIDFGIVKLLDDEDPLTHGSTGPLGTPRYASPELVSGGELDVRADVFSLGVVLFELLVDGWPFGRWRKQTPVRVLQNMLQTKALTLAASLSGHPDPEAVAEARGSSMDVLMRELQSFEEVLAGAVAVDVRERTKSASQLAKQLRVVRSR